MSQDSSTRLEVQNISYSYGRREVLRNVSLSGEKGDCIGILGINGGGKSTLLSILAGILTPKSGSITCFNHDLLHEKKAFRTLIGYLPQENPLMEELTAKDNLRLWYGSKVSSNLPILKQLQLEELLSQKVSGFSGGMKRRLAIACTMAQNQPVILLDEPSSSLDLYQKKIIRDSISAFTRTGGITLLSTHDPLEIEMCTKLYYMTDNTTMPGSKEEALLFLQEGRR